MIPDKSIYQQPVLLCKWFEDQANFNEFDCQVLDFLGDKATEDQYKTFIRSDALLSYRFCDSLALALIHFSEKVKAEIANNFFDECGMGNVDKFHTREFTLLLESIGLEESTSVIWGEHWQPYAGYNLYFLLGLNRQYHIMHFGSLAMPELFDPNRDEAIVRGLRRLWEGQVKMNFYLNHIGTDVRHGRQWLENVIAPVVIQEPELGRELAIGALLRMEAMRRYNQYLAQILGLLT